VSSDEELDEPIPYSDDYVDAPQVSAGEFGLLCFLQYFWFN